MKKNETIQIIRILAAVGVFLVHFGQVMEFNGIIRKITDMGQYGLYIFFVLSGYLVCNWDGKEPLKWIKKKIIRLVPLYYFILLIYILYHQLILKDVPIDARHIGWTRYILGIHSLIPSQNLFWKSLHALWYVSTVWCFYLLILFTWRKLSTISVYGWYIVFIILSIIASLIYQQDPMARVNFFCFLQYFVLGIIAYKYKNGKHIIIVPLFCVVLFWVYRNWLVQNILVASLFCIILIFIKHRNCFLDVRWKRVIDMMDECTYALFLIHPMFIDIIIPNIKKYIVYDLAVGLISVILLMIVIILMHYCYEVKMQMLMQNRGRCSCKNK